MKAIQIFEVNRKLIEAWGEKEELTWANSFGFLVGSVLVVSDDIPQGYAVKTASNFYDEYKWASNFGAHGWSEIEKVGKETEPKPTPEFEEKRAALALFLFNMNNGPCASLPEIFSDPEYGLEYLENYMADAHDILLAKPHLLGLKTREAMKLDKDN